MKAQHKKAILGEARLGRSKEAAAGKASEENEEAVAEQAVRDFRQLDLMQFVKEPSWREVLLEAIQSEQMNPWEIDLTKVADAYLKQVRKMEALDLRLPANVILASALLLHYKAQALRLEEPEPVTEDGLIPLQDEAIPELAYNANNARVRIVTLQELMEAVDDVLKQGPREIPRPERPQPIYVQLPKETMNELMQKVYFRAQELKDKEDIVLFSRLVKSFNGHGEAFSELVSYNLLPVLHLVQEDKMLAWQDLLFGEIFLKVN